jgi:hypothetical protein
MGNGSSDQVNSETSQKNKDAKPNKQNSQSQSESCAYNWAIQLGLIFGIRCITSENTVMERMLRSSFVIVLDWGWDFFPYLTY